MLQDMGVVLNRSDGVPHEEMARRLLGCSKETQWTEDDMYFYSYLTEVEFYEFIVRVADEVYHRSYAVVIEPAEEEEKEEAKEEAKEG